MKLYLDYILVIVVYAALAVTGLLGNLWVLTTVSSQLLGCSGQRTRTYKSVVQSSAFIYLLLLSIVDLISLIPIPMLITDIYENHFPFGLAMCKMLFLCEAMNKTLSPLVLTALSIDRYIAVCHPTLHWMRQTKFSLIVAFACITFSLGFIIPIIFHADVQAMVDGLHREVSKCSLNYKINMFDLMHGVMCFLIPLIVICAVYLAILKKLYYHTRFSTVGQKTTISLSQVVKCSVMVVAFYFICWTPYWLMRFHEVVTRAQAEMQFENYNESKMQGSSDYDENAIISIQPEVSRIWFIEYEFEVQFVFMYLLHALPYAQCAFNWLFYAFLNRNLRNSNPRFNGARSQATSTVLDNGPATTSTGFTPLWRNIQQVGTQIKSAGIDTGNVLLKMSPFRGRSRIQSRSSTYLECSGQLLPPTSNLSSSLLDIPRRPSLVPRQEPSLAGKALSLNTLPQFNVIEPSTEISHGGASDSSSVEWL